MIVEDAIAVLIKKYSCLPIHNLELDPLKGDIDIHCPEKNIEEAGKYLSSAGFVIWRDELNRLQAEIFIKGQLFNLHLYENEGFSFYLCSDISKEFKSTLKSSDDFSSLPYLTFRTLFFFKPKYLPILEKKSEELERESFYVKFLDKNPFLRKITFKDFKNIVNKKFFALVSSVGLKCALHVYSQMVSLKLRHFGRGRVIAVLGVDGVGKTTLVETIRTAIGVKAIYMGNNRLFLQPLHDFLSKFGKVSVPFTFILCWFEQFIRRINAAISSFMGKTVILERYPKYEIFAYNSQLARSLGNIFYGLLFPDVAEVVVIWCNEEKILSRKDEGLPLEKIIEMQSELVNIARKRKKPTVFIENLELDNGLNGLLSVVRS